MSRKILDLVFNAKLQDSTDGFRSLSVATKKLENNFSTSFSNMTNSWKGFQQKINLGLSTIATKVPSLMGLGGLTAALGSALSIKTAADFETDLEKMKVSVKVDKTSLAELERLAIDLGNATQFSGGDALKAMKFLGSAGWNSTQVKEVTPSVLGLTGAARIKLDDMPMEETAKSLADAMAALKLPSSYAPTFADQLAYGFSESNQDFRQLMENFRKFAGTSQVSGISHTSAIAYSMALSNLGVKSEEAGTALASFFSRMSNLPRDAKKVLAAKKVSQKDWGEFINPITGKVSDPFKIFDILQKYKFTPGEIAELFASEAGKHLKGLVSEEAISKLRSLKAILDDTSESAQYRGRVELLNSASLKGLNGELEKLSSAVDTLAVSIGQTGVLSLASMFVEALAKVVDGLTFAVQGIFSLISKVYDFAPVKALVNLPMSMLSAFTKASQIMEKTGQPDFPLKKSDPFDVSSLLPKFFFQPQEPKEIKVTFEGKNMPKHVRVRARTQNKMLDLPRGMTWEASL